MKRPTLKMKVDATGHGEYVLIQPDGSSLDISNMVSGTVIKVDLSSANTVIVRLIGMELDLEVEAEDIPSPEIGES